MLSFTEIYTIKNQITVIYNDREHSRTTRLVVKQVVNCVMLDYILVEVNQRIVYPVKLAGMKMNKEVQIVATVELENLHYKKHLLVQNVRKVNGVIN